MSAFSRSSTGISVVQHFSSLINGKTIVITGPSANSIGAETAISLAHASPSIILLAERSEAKISPVIKEIHTLNPSITTHFVPLDLASQKSIRKAASLINSLVEKIDILINNAGVMAVPAYQTTEDGIELQFGCNHIGHFLLTNLVLEKLLTAGRGGQARIVNVSSTGYELGGVQFDDWNFNEGKDYDPWQAYAQSKTANVLFSSTLASRLKDRNIQSFALQPGYVPTSNLQAHVTSEMWSNVLQQISESSGGQEFEPPKTLQEGCSTTLVAALDPSISESSGGFLQDCIIRPVPQDHAVGVGNQVRLWDLSERLVGQQFDIFI
ncbi:uncharacterized protein EAF02_011862 [Botrytis sinoallii]|uniref:uncharacterized protein n=1 Tax=Botrytis sinoallii TaxID=1463999 RepID=UPI0019001797|nr:uncharacterized protein EAF02_011862 [Botrytis sinoallii]KAF7853557.1 hypothetical protein EAF02_011862 [Botrytis sinoallii]